MKSLSWQHRLSWRIKKLIDIFFAKEVIEDPSDEFVVTNDKTDERKLAIRTCSEMYANFNMGKHVNHDPNTFKSLKSITSKDFIIDVIGKIHYFDISNFRFRIIFNSAKSLAWKIHQYICEPKNVIKLYEQAAKDNKIQIQLGKYGTFTCNQTLYADNKTFLRFKGKHHSFWLVQHFSFYSLYFPNERFYFSLKNHTNYNKHKKCIRNFHLTIFELFEKLVQWNEHNTPVSFSGLLLAYRRPFHFFADMLPTADLLMSSSPNTESLLNKFITLTGRCFYMPQRFFGAQYASFNLKHQEINTYLIENNTFFLQPVKNISPNLNNFNVSADFYQKMIKCSIESATSDFEFQKTLEQARNTTPLLWFGVCGERRSWIESTEAICKIVKHFQKMYPNVGLIIDGLTAPEGISREQCQQGPAKKEQQIFTAIAAQLPDINIINAIGLKSYQKIALAHEIDFFLTCFLTDSLYVAQFNSKPGLAYGTTASDVSGHRHPMTVLLPKVNITDVPIVDPTTHRTVGIRYSINPELMLKATLNVFELYQQLMRKSNEMNIIFSGQDFSLKKNSDNNSIKIVSISSKATDVCIGEQYFVAKNRCSPLAYPIGKSKKYLFRFEAFAKNESALYIFAYANGKNIFKSLRFEAGRARSVTFPTQATAFRLFIHLNGHDELEFFDIHWNTDEIVGSVRLGANLDLAIKSRGNNGPA